MNEAIYDYVFHFNPMTETWSAIHRDSYVDYWSDSKIKSPDVLRSSDIKTLIELITKGNEFIKSI